jgi:atypical dual specificity phosphatase
MLLLNKLALYPTIVWGVVLEYLGIRKWYTRIDEHCIIGALPMLRNYEEILKKEKVNAVLTLNEDHELIYSVPRVMYERMGIEFYQISIRDYIGVASLEQIKSGVDFINKHKSMNQCVYVHCKAGRYRSALIVVCYLINSKNMKPQEAIDYLKSIRPHVILDKKRQTEAINKYYEHFISIKHS